MSVKFDRIKVWKEEERNIVIGMITNTEFLKQLQDIYKPQYFALDYAKIVSSWCMDYYKKYEKAPFQDIQSIFEAQKQNILDDTKIEEIEIFLDSLNRTYINEKYNVEYNIDKAISYFKESNLDIFIEKLRGYKILKDFVKAEAEIADYVRIEKNQCEGVDVLSDNDAVIRALRDDSSENILLRFPGELGKLVRPWERGDFCAFAAPAKRGKTYWLVETAYMSIMQGLNVVFFSFEMTEQKMLTRFYQRILCLPLPEHEGEDEVEVSVPCFDRNYENNKTIHISKEIRKTINVKDTTKIINSMNTISKGKKFKLICAPPYSMSVADIRLHLNNLEYYEDFIPDVIISDYADITRPERNNEKRHQIDETWLAYRALAMDRNCLVVTASHSNKQTFERDIRQGDLSEDSRKMNHVTWMGSLNQSDEDADQQIMRMSVLADRYKRFSKNVEAVMLQSLDIGRVCLDSRLAEKEGV